MVLRARYQKMARWDTTKTIALYIFWPIITSFSKSALRIRYDNRKALSLAVALFGLYRSVSPVIHIIFWFPRLEVLANRFHEPTSEGVHTYKIKCITQSMIIGQLCTQLLEAITEAILDRHLGMRPQITGYCHASWWLVQNGMGSRRKLRGKASVLWKSCRSCRLPPLQLSLL